MFDVYISLYDMIYILHLQTRFHHLQDISVVWALSMGLMCSPTHSCLLLCASICQWTALDSTSGLLFMPAAVLPATVKKLKRRTCYCLALFVFFLLKTFQTKGAHTNGEHHPPIWCLLHACWAEGWLVVDLLDLRATQAWGGAVTPLLIVTRWFYFAPLRPSLYSSPLGQFWWISVTLDSPWLPLFTWGISLLEGHHSGCCFKAGQGALHPTRHWAEGAWRRQLTALWGRERRRTSQRSRKGEQKKA